MPAATERVFLDADVLIAGSASSTGASRRILQLSGLGLLDAVSSQQARREVERNLRGKLPAALPMLRVLADTVWRWVDDPSEREVEALTEEANEKDVPILAAAVGAGCDALLTFNTRDFRTDRIRVERPGDFLVGLRRRLGGLAEQE